jgi:hypothetical protein
MSGHVARREDRINSYRILLGKPECKRPLGRPTSRWEETIKMDLQKKDRGHGLC